MADHKLNIGFLFGAGAESKGNFNLPSGMAYMKETVLYKSNTDSQTKVLSSFFKSKDTRGRIYSSHKINADTRILSNLIYHRAEEDKEFYIKHQETIESYITSSETNELCSLHQMEKKETTRKDPNIAKVFINILKNGVFDAISRSENPFLDQLLPAAADGSDEIDFSIGIAGLLDGYFHTIIDPQRYGRIRFSKVMNYYWACYFSITKAIVAHLRKDDSDLFSEYVDDEKNLNPVLTLRKIGLFTRDLYGAEVQSGCEQSYYYRINKKLNEKCALFHCDEIATTNYFKFTDILRTNTIHLNGELKFFEFPGSLDIVDLLETDKTIDGSELFFPFIFGQSLVKPIVHER